jgi:hypothetical protein
MEKQIYELGEWKPNEVDTLQQKVSLYTKWFH